MAAFGVELLIYGVVAGASAFGGYALARYLGRRKTKMDSELYNADGTFNPIGAVAEFRRLFGSKAGVIAAAIKEMNK